MLRLDRRLLCLVVLTLHLPFALASGRVIRCETFFYLPDGALLVSSGPPAQLSEASRRRQYIALMEADIRATQGDPPVPVPDGIRQDLRELAVQALFATRPENRVTVTRQIESFISRVRQTVSAAETYMWPSDLRETVAQNSGFLSWQELTSLFPDESTQPSGLLEVEEADRDIWRAYLASSIPGWRDRARPILRLY